MNKERGDYRCLITLKDGPWLEVYSTSSNALQRLAKGLALLSGKKATDFQSSTNGCGCTVDPETNVVSVIETDGPFRGNNINIFSRIISVDGSKKNIKDRVESLGIQQELEGGAVTQVQLLKKETHKIVYKTLSGIQEEADISAGGYPAAASPPP